MPATLYDDRGDDEDDEKAEQRPAAALGQDGAAAHAAEHALPLLHQHGHRDAPAKQQDDAGHDDSMKPMPTPMPTSRPIPIAGSRTETAVPMQSPIDGRLPFRSSMVARISDDCSSADSTRKSRPLTRLTEPFPHNARIGHGDVRIAQCGTDHRLQDQKLKNERRQGRKDRRQPDPQAEIAADHRERIAKDLADPEILRSLHRHRSH